MQCHILISSRSWCSSLHLPRPLQVKPSMKSPVAAERRKSDMDIKKVTRLILEMYKDHATYPQLRLPDMQATRLNQLLREVSKE
jgi:hypothetical protein